MANKEYVILKGFAGGVNMIFDPDADINEIIGAMREKIKGAGGFFKGECDIRISGRNLSKSDELRISSVMNTVFPEANIVFIPPEKKQEKPEPEIVAKNHTHMGAWFMEELEKAAKQSRAMLKADKQGILKPHKIDVRLYTGNINEGNVLKTPGDLLVVGNVSRGAVVSAEGSVYIMGKLSGRAEAGTDGDRDCRIYATDFGPQSVEIAHVNMEFDKIAQENLPKMAYLMNCTVMVEKIL